MRRLLSLFLFTFFVASSWAQTTSSATVTVPPLIKVSGAISGDSGSTVGVTFALYAEQTGGAPLWMETQNVSVDANGRYTIFLGVNHVNGVPLDLFASGEARWLGVQPEGQAEQTRVQLVSVPYAMTAGDAQTLGGQPLSAFVMASAANGASTTTAGSAATAAASGGGIVALASPQDTGGNVTTTLGGTTNYLAKFTSALNVENSSMVYDSGTAVGIGTTAPAATLHVVSTSTSAGFVDVYNNTLNAVTFATRAARGTPTSPAVVQAGDIIGGFTGRGWTGSGGFSGGRGALIIHANETWSSAAQSTYMQFNTTGLGTNYQSERMRLDNAGNLGIGTSNPGGTPPSPLPAPVTLEVNGNIKLTAGSSGQMIFADGSMQSTAATASSYIPSTGGTLTGNLTGTTATFNTVNAATSFSLGGQAFAFGSPNGFNAFLGFAGNSTMTGNYNTASGYQALYSNTTGSNNTASGTGALFRNTSGGGNTASGSWVLYNNTTGYDNTGSGNESLYYNTTGYDNTASGSQALYSNTTGNSNTGSGSWALYYNTTGNSNTGSGYQTLYNNTTGGYNTASGYQTLYSNTTGGYNTASGYQTLYSNTTGGYNTASGVSALYSNTTGNLNTGSGYQTLYNNTTGGYNTASGYLALFSNTTGYDNTAIGSGALSWNTTGTANVALGMTAGGTMDGSWITGLNNTAIGANSAFSTGTLTNATAIGAGAIVSASNALVLGSAGTNVGIGTPAPAYTLDVHGTANFTGLVNFAAGQTFPGFSGSLVGDVIGTQSATSVVKVNGGAIPVSAAVVGTNGSGQFVAQAGTLSNSISGNAATVTNGAYLNVANTFTAAQTITATGTTLTTSGGTTGLSATGSNNGVSGTSSGTSGYGVYGQSADALGTGVYGYASSSSGSTTGTFGMSESTTGTGVTGIATSGTASANYGVWGRSYGDSGTGVYGYASSSSTSGVNYGVWGKTNSSTGIAGLFNNQGGGKVLSGQSAGAEVFSVSGGGDIAMAGCLKNMAGTSLNIGTCSSDMRLKTDIVPFAPVLSRLVQLQPVHYRWRVAQFPEYHFGEALNSGLLAQEVEKVFPEMVGIDGHGYKTVNYSELPYLLLGAVRELKTENDALQAKLSAQTELVRDIESRLAQLEQKQADETGKAVATPGKVR